ncbi:hypothetical protein BOX37_23215 [Nocardia mangyaensis]|uniref:Immunity protein 35 domain-containing protein n=1 Tax=Nocardia mangyaensis TaxID=2213200 RepID=A0A1J0VWB7_9NOCA|nr:hypothetical protein [Nocardia mangyaensis]APE36360.1 hypothetical protein BOX37_23215 [Nocardia mangyaensis]
MDIHAYPTDARTPVDREEAIRIAAEHLPGEIPETDRHIVEFADGFTVFDVRPLHAPSDRPIPVGGSVHVIDKETGAVSFWPTYPSDLIAAQYALMRESGRLIVEANWPDPD